MLLTAPVMEETPTEIALRALRAQELLDELRLQLAVAHPVRIEVVVYDPLVFSVKPMDASREAFRLSMELGFLHALSEEELRAALAHELGHVTIFTRHPFLHTERLANDIGLQAVSRGSIEKVYRKLWAYEGSDGVSIDRLLGPPPAPPPLPD